MCAYLSFLWNHLSVYFNLNFAMNLTSQNYSLPAIGREVIVMSFVHYDIIPALTDHSLRLFCCSAKIDLRSGSRPTIFFWGSKMFCTFKCPSCVKPYISATWFNFQIPEAPQQMPSAHWGDHGTELNWTELNFRLVACHCTNRMAVHYRLTIFITVMW